MEKIKKLDMSDIHCPCCTTPKHTIGMDRHEDEVVCPKCGFSSPIILVNHRVE